MSLAGPPSGAPTAVSMSSTTPLSSVPTSPSNLLRLLRLLSQAFNHADVVGDLPSLGASSCSDVASLIWPSILTVSLIGLSMLSAPAVYSSSAENLLRLLRLLSQAFNHADVVGDLPSLGASSCSDVASLITLLIFTVSSIGVSMLSAPAL